jgi:hypothetical protein
MTFGLRPLHDLRAPPAEAVLSPIPRIPRFVWQPEGVPVSQDHRRAHDHDDVEWARRGVRRADVPYGPRPRRTFASSWQTFAHRYGWRAYALPILVVVTVAALLTTDQVRHRAAAAPVAHPAVAHTTSASSPPVAPSNIPLQDDVSGQRINPTALKAAALPPGGPYTESATGTFRTLKGTSPKVGSGPLFRYSIDVENGVTGVDLAQYEHLVVTTLSDPRSWSGHGVTLQRVDSGPREFRVSLTSAMTVRKLCGYDIPVETSCYAKAGPNNDANRVVLNVARWVRGASAYLGNVNLYRVYMINHEDGHALGHNHAHQCLPGGLAPAMMQQTFGLRSTATGKFCQANPWPYPPGVRGAPGAEQIDTDKNNEYGKGD